MVCSPITYRRTVKAVCSVLPYSHLPLCVSVSSSFHSERVNVGGCTEHDSSALLNVN